MEWKDFLKTEFGKELKEDLDLYFSDNSINKDKYTGEISNELSEKFSNFNSQNDRDQMQIAYLPTYIVGDIESNDDKYMVVSLNPGFNKEKNPKEEELRNKDRDTYKKYVLNYFKMMDENNIQNNDYYGKWKGFFKQLWNFKGNKKIYIEEFQKHLINVDIIPYHSTSFNSSAVISSLNKTRGRKDCDEKLKNYIEGRLKNIISLAKDLKCKLVIFSGQTLYADGVFKNFYTDEYKKGETISFGSGNNIKYAQLFKIKGIPCVQMNFIGNGRSPEGYKNLILKRIKKKFNL